MPQDGVKMEGKWPMIWKMALKMRPKTPKMRFLRDVPRKMHTLEGLRGSQQKPVLDGNGKRAKIGERHRVIPRYADAERAIESHRDTEIFRETEVDRYRDGRTYVKDGLQ